MQEARSPPKLTGGWEDWHTAKSKAPSIVPKAKSKALRARMAKEIEKQAAKKLEEYLKQKGL